MREIRLLDEDLSLALYLIDLLLKLLLLINESLLLGQGSRPPVFGIFLILNFFFFLRNVGFKPRFFSFLCLAHRESCPFQFSLFQLLQVLNLLLLLKVVLISLLFSHFFSVTLLFDLIVSEADLAQLLLLVAHLLYSVDARLLLEVLMKRNFFCSRVQDRRSWWLLTRHEGRRVRVVVRKVRPRGVLLADVFIACSANLISCWVHNHCAFA